VTLPPGRWHDHLSGVERQGGEVGLAELLDRLPVAVLTTL